MKRKICMLLAVLVLLLCMTPQVRAAGVLETGSCGDNAAYTLYADGRLVISGSGSINEQAFYGPVFENSSKITSVEIGDGITEIGSCAFWGCTSLVSVDLGEGLEILGEGAFMACSALKEIVIPDSVTTMNGGQPMGTPTVGAFDGCTNLERITIGKGVTVIPWGFLTGSEKLEELIIPDNVTAIDCYAFSANSRLTYVQIPAGVTEIGAMAFVNTYSLTTVVFLGSAPAMESAFYCGSFNHAGFYPADDPTWSDVGNLVSQSNLISLVPYTTDGEGNILPVIPEDSQLAGSLIGFREEKYPEGSAYPDSYSYIINGDFLTGYGDEAFAFQLSDALYGYLPISEKRSVVFSELCVGDILYMGDETCVITELAEETVQTAGVDENGTVYYDRTLTRAQVEAAQACRTRCGVSPYPGMTDPALEYELTGLPTELPTEEQVYETILSMQESYPEGMPYSSKNHFYSQTESPVWYVGEMPLLLNMSGHGCSAFSYLLSDLCFGNLSARYIRAEDMEYDDLRVGDSLLYSGHQVTILEVYEDHVVVVEGNYNEMIHWFRSIPRAEIEGLSDVYTRWPAGYPFTDVPEDSFYFDSVMWAVKNGITTGATDTTFNPNGQCQRAQVVTFLWRAVGSPEPVSSVNPFEDVKETDFYYKAVLWAVESGITNGVDATHFGPFTYCNRAQVVTFLYRAMEQPEIAGTECPFTDVEAGEWYENAVLWAVENGITNGMEASIFGVNSTCNRAQVVTFLYRTYVN